MNILIETSFIFESKNIKKLADGKVSWQSPSNIALVKYWGKTDPQIPKNSSISFTLSNCHTKTTLAYTPRSTPSNSFDFQVFFEGEEKTSFRPKIESFFNRIVDYIPFIRDYKFKIFTENSFPHSSGIASSASGMSALALCLMSLQRILDPQLSEFEFLHKASFLARLGSGSAARSIKGPLVVWGQHPHIKGSSDTFGIPYPGDIHEVFKTFNDTILLVDKGVKQVSSTVGHNLMLDHPFADARFSQAQDHMSKIVPILKNGDLESFIKIVEKEALSLHAMMMCSDPYFILMKPNTLEIIERIWNFRKTSGTHICFTLDAGANVHVLFPEKDQELVHNFIQSELLRFCENKQFIHDKVGNGSIAI